MSNEQKSRTVSRKLLLVAVNFHKKEENSLRQGLTLTKLRRKLAF